MADDGIMWALLLFLAAGRRGAAAPGSVAADLPPGEWIWPMLTLPDGRPPEISSGWGSPRDNGARRHKGVDIMYRRTSKLPKPLTGKLRYPLPDHGSVGYEVPEGAPIVAAHAGRIWATGKTTLGNFVIIDHGPEPWSTFYQHLEALTIPPHRKGKQTINGERGLEVSAGAPLGICGYGQGGQEIRHLHFELRRGKTAIDPAPIMKNWRKL